MGLESDHLFEGPDPEVAYIPAGNVHTGRQEKDIHQQVQPEVTWEDMPGSSQMAEVEVGGVSLVERAG